MPDMKVTIKVPAQLVTGLQEQGVADIGNFIESFLRGMEAEDLVEMNQEALWGVAEEEDDGLDDEEFDDELEELDDEDEDWDEEDEEDWDEEDDDF